MSELGYPLPVSGGDDPARAPNDSYGESILAANALGQTKRILVDSLGNVLVSGIVQENPSTNANVSTVTVTTSSTVLVGSNTSRKGLIFQSKDSPVYYILGTTPATTSTYSYYILKLNSLELENFYGTVSAVVATGTATVQVTEKI